MKTVNNFIRVIFTMAFVYLGSFVNAQTTTWEGDVNNSWFTAGNWTNGIPDETKEAIIAPVAPGDKDCIVSVFTGGIAKKITIQDGGKLTMSNGSPALSVVPDQSDGIHIQEGGNLIVWGTINIHAENLVSERGLFIEGNCLVTGNLNIDDIQGQGVHLASTGLLDIDGGRVWVGNENKVWNDGMENHGTVNITEGGRFFVNDIVGTGIKNYGNIDSEGTINIGVNGDPNDIGGHGVYNYNIFTSTGDINITEAALDGIRNEGTIQLEGTINISEIGLHGILNTGDPSTISLTNDVELVVLNIGLVGLQNNQNTSFYYAPNSGSIHIDGTGNDGIKNLVGGVFDVAGPIFIGTNGSITTRAVENNQDFLIGDACSSLIYIGDGELGDVSGGMVNNGTIVYEDNQTGSLGENNGIVISKGGGALNITTDNGIYTTENQNIWKGCSSPDWDDANNWTDGSVPESDDVVIIQGEMDFDPNLNSSSTCLSVYIEEFANLTISDNGVLSVSSNETITIDNYGLLNNQGEINITRTNNSLAALANREIFINSGTVNITKGLVGLFSGLGSEFNNQPGGEIQIVNCWRAGDFFGEDQANAGLISVTGGTTGLSVYSKFTNATTGTVRVDGTSSIAFLSNSSEVGFTNHGTISLGLNSPLSDSAFELYNGGFENASTGVINIGSGEKGMIIRTSNLENNGLIEIDGLSGEAIEVQSGTSVTNSKDIHIGFFTPPAKGILVDGLLSNGEDASIFINTDHDNGLVVNSEFINNNSFFTNQGIMVNGDGNILGNGSFELRGDWENVGSNDLSTATLIFSGTNISNINNTSQILEINELDAAKMNNVLKLNSGLQVNGSINLSYGKIDLNAQVITLSADAVLSGETNTNYIFDSEGSGAGFISYSNTLDGSNGASFDAGNLGLSISLAGILEDFSVKRRHYSSVGGTNIINRTYEVDYSSFTGDITLIPSYLNSEQGAVDESSIGLFAVENGSLSEIVISDSDEVQNTVNYQNIAQKLELAFATSDRNMVWQGTVSSDWREPNNWNIFGIPNKLYNVEIPSGTPADPIIGPGFPMSGKSVYIATNATLTNTAVLKIDGSQSIGLVVIGDFYNVGNGVLKIDNTASNAIEIGENGNFENEANIIQDGTNNFGGRYLSNNGSFSNTGTIIINGSIDALPIFNGFSADLVNNGEINIGSDITSDFNASRCVWNLGVLENSDAGILNIVNHDETGISNAAGANMQNYGSINIGQDANALIVLDGIENAGDFWNYSVINIDNIARIGLVQNGGSFENAGTINIGQNFDTAIGDKGILASGNFENTGTINIDNTIDHAIGLFSSTADFYNLATINIGHTTSISGVGIEVPNTSVFQNLAGGIIDVKNTQNGLENYGTFNNAGDLYFDNTGQTGIYNESIFINTGTIGGEPKNVVLNSTLGGTLSPGFSPGWITFEGSLEFDPGAKLIIEVDGSGFGEKDRITAAEVVILDNLSLEVEVNYTPEDGDYIGFINASVIDGDFESVTLPAGWALVTGPEIGIKYSTVLPVDLISFKAQAKDQQVQLDWQTATEINNAGFEIWHSTDADDWQQAGFVEGLGNATTVHDYQFTHIHPETGENYYHLRQVDFDGRYEDSDIKLVNIDLRSEQSGITLFPNPSIDFINIQVDDSKSIERFQIIDINGQVVMVQDINEIDHTLKIGIDTLTPSTYTLVLFDTAGNAICKRFSKIRF